jgi:hypothetical protein
VLTKGGGGREHVIGADESGNRIKAVDTAEAEAMGDSDGESLVMKVEIATNDGLLLVGVSKHALHAQFAGHDDGPIEQHQSLVAPAEANERGGQRR